MRNKDEIGELVLYLPYSSFIKHYLDGKIYIEDENEVNDIGEEENKRKIKSKLVLYP